MLAKPEWSVRARRYEWQIESATERVEEILPKMQTDIVLENREARIIIDTKFTSILGSRRQYKEIEETRETLKSGYIYQIYAYLRSQEKADDPLSQKSYGLLLHPAIGENLDEKVKLQGHIIRFATVDLMADAKTIRDRLLEFTNIEQWKDFSSIKASAG